jgi:formate hydrogenlyase subunit 3/multisubunit Na+/H+ antiporter MnhD subunit
MNVKYLIILFPIIPIIWVSLSLLVKYFTKRDISSEAILANAVVQLLIGGYLILYFRGYEGLYNIVLSEWKYSIEFSFDNYRIFFLTAFLVPSFLTVFHYRQFTDYNIRTIFLFYLAGCSGLIVAGDIFNFYIFYEVMIMAAYILIAVNRKYYASIKYMMFGAVSSAIFLAGIILLYASGSYFSYSYLSRLTEYNPNNIRFVLKLFTIAFLIKGAFFPVSGWVATCHSATNGLVSAFLSSFTIFSGIYGLFYFVILPAELLGYQDILVFIRILSILTMLIPAVILFFEPDFKRCIAGSTVFTVGFIGLLLSSGAYYLALFYMVIHAVYKSFMFLSYDDLVIEKFGIYGNIKTVILLIAAILFTVGFFPSLTYFIKYRFLAEYDIYKLLTYTAMTLMLGSFFKFRFLAGKIRIKRWFYLFFPLFITGFYLLNPFGFYFAGYSLILDLTIILTVTLFARLLYDKLSFLSCLDTKYIYINMNYELLYVVVLIVSQIMILRLNN